MVLFDGQLILNFGEQMKNTFRLAFVIGIFSVILACSENALAQKAQVPMVGGFKAVSVKDAGVINAAKFAVNKIAKNEEMDLTLKSIEKAGRQVVAGTNYKLLLRVTYADGGELYSMCITAVVYKNLKRVSSLTSWNSLECPE